jgi:hypothetical protein
MARTVVPPDLPGRHPLRRHDLHGNVHCVQHCSALTYTITALLTQMARPPQPRSRRSQNARQSSQPTAKPRLDRARVPRDQSAIYVRKAHGGRTLPTLGGRLGLVYDQAAVRGSRLVVQVEAHVAPCRSGYGHHVLPAVDCKLFGSLRNR